MNDYFMKWLKLEFPELPYKKIEEKWLIKMDDMQKKTDEKRKTDTCINCNNPGFPYCPEHDAP